MKAFISKGGILNMVAKQIYRVKLWLFSSLIATAVFAQDNPYQVVYHWGELPGGRPMGIVTGVQPDPDGEHLWIIERCSANQCAGSVSYTHLTLPTSDLV